MPNEYAEQAPAPLLFFPFNADIAIAVVVDQDNTYAYVREDDPAVWEVTRQQVYDAAIENLDAASRDIEMQSGAAPDRFIAVEVGDGYDAVRLLLPGLRSFIAQRLGTSFFAGVPNRDFLICWATDVSAEFDGFVRQKVAKDNAEQPYALTPEIIVATLESLRPEAPAK